MEECYKKQQAGQLTEAQAKKEAADRVRALRYDDGKGYFWMDDYDGVNVVLLGTDSEGKSRLNQPRCKWGRPLYRPASLALAIPSAWRRRLSS